MATSVGSTRKYYVRPGSVIRGMVRMGIVRYASSTSDLGVLGSGIWVYLPQFYIGRIGSVELAIDQRDFA